jgi:pyrroloquinoline quinone biosynthesis protein D
MIAAEDVYRIAARARLRKDPKGEGWLLVYPERGLALSESAGSILQLCDGQRTVNAVVDALVAKYEGAPRDVLERDVNAFFQSLLDKSLLERV